MESDPETMLAITIAGTAAGNILGKRIDKALSHVAEAVQTKFAMLPSGARRTAFERGQDFVDRTVDELRKRAAAAEGESPVSDHMAAAVEEPACAMFFAEALGQYGGNTGTAIRGQIPQFSVVCGMRWG